MIASVIRGALYRGNPSAALARACGLELAGKAAVARPRAERDDIGAQASQSISWVGTTYFQGRQLARVRRLGGGIDALQFDDDALTDAV